MIKKHRNNKLRRKIRTRSNINGTAEVPRLSVFRSNKEIYLQVIDDKTGSTLVASSTAGLKKREKAKTERAIELGKSIGDKMKKKGIKRAVFDRGSYQYHGRIKGLADGIRSSGIKF